MSPARLVRQADKAGIELRLSRAGLVLVYCGAPDPVLLKALRANRRAVEAFLQASGIVPVVPATSTERFGDRLKAQNGAERGRGVRRGRGITSNQTA